MKVTGNVKAIVDMKLTVEVTTKCICIIIVGDVVKTKNTLKGILQRKVCNGSNQGLEK